MNDEPIKIARIYMKSGNVIVLPNVVTGEFKVGSDGHILSLRLEQDVTRGGELLSVQTILLSQIEAITLEDVE